jgi:hypothetical protein
MQTRALGALFNAIAAVSAGFADHVLVLPHPHGVECSDRATTGERRRYWLGPRGWAHAVDGAVPRRVRCQLDRCLRTAVHARLGLTREQLAQAPLDSRTCQF